MLYDRLSAIEQKKSTFDDALTTEERRGLIYVRRLRGRRLPGHRRA